MNGGSRTEIESVSGTISAKMASGMTRVDRESGGLPPTLNQWSGTHDWKYAWLPWSLVYASGAMVGLVRSQACSWTSLGCLEPYWLEFWLLDYSQGFQRRGLLGTVARLFTTQYLDVVVVNAAAMTTCVALLVAMVTLLYKATSTFWTRAAIAVLLASPLSSVFFETLGDPLQVVFALMLLGAFGLSRVHRPSMRAFYCGIFCVVSVLIHEAAIFLFVPAVVLMFEQSRPVSLRTYAVFAAIGAPLLLAVILFGGITPPDPAYRAYNSISGAVIPREPDPLLPLPLLLEEEVLRNVGTPARAGMFALKFPRIWYVPCLALVLVAGTVWRTGPGRDLWRYWLYLTVCSAPLYAIAHDWGRFSAMTFWLAVVVTAFTGQKPGSGPLPHPATRPLRMPDAGIVFGVVATLILAADAINQYYREDGMPLASLLLMPAVVTAGISWLVWSRKADPV